MLRVGRAIPDPEHPHGYDCGATYEVTDYYFAAAMSRYDVIVENQTISFVQPPSNIPVVDMANNTDLDPALLHQYWDKATVVYHTTLAGISAAAYNSFNLYWAATPDPDNNAIETVWLPSPFLVQMVPDLEGFFESNDNCLPVLKDPFPDIQVGLNEIMFRAGIWAAANYNNNRTALAPLLDAGIETYYNTTGTRIDAQNVFISVYWYFLGAALINLVTIMVIVCTFYGWWRLGRAVSLSPLEIAKVRFISSAVRHDVAR